MDIPWKEGFEIRVRIDGNTAVIEANRAGLLSLAEQLMMLAYEQDSTHIHYDEYNSLEEGSSEMIIGKTDEVSSSL